MLRRPPRVTRPTPPFPSPPLFRSAWLTPAEQQADIAHAGGRLRAELGRAPALFAYPYGEISLALRQAVIDAGFAGAFGQHSGAAGGSEIGRAPVCTTVPNAHVVCRRLIYNHKRT